MARSFPSWLACTRKSLIMCTWIGLPNSVFILKWLLYFNPLPSLVDSYALLFGLRTRLGYLWALLEWQPNVNGRVIRWYTKHKQNVCIKTHAGLHTAKWTEHEGLIPLHSTRSSLPISNHTKIGRKLWTTQRSNLKKVADLTWKRTLLLVLFRGEFGWCMVNPVLLGATHKSSKQDMAS